MKLEDTLTPAKITTELANAAVTPPDDLLARCTATIPASSAARPSVTRPLLLAGVAIAIVIATLLVPTRPAQRPTGMPAAFAQTEAAMRQVNAWHTKEWFVHLDWLREKPRPLHLSGHYPLQTETWYRADAGELSYFTSRPDEPINKALFKPNGDYWMRMVNWRRLARDPRVQKREEERMRKWFAKLHVQSKGKFPLYAPLPPAPYLRRVVNAKGWFHQWDTVSRDNWGPNSWNGRREFMQSSITKPESWGLHAAMQALSQPLSDAQTRQLRVTNRLLQSERSVWKGKPAERFDFQIIPTEPKGALSKNLPDVFLIAFVDPETHRVIATQEQFRDRGQTKRLMFRQQEFDYTDTDPERFSVEAFTRGAVVPRNIEIR